MKVDKIVKKLQEVYDPEFPIVDIYTLGLIYDIKVDKKKLVINIIMTFTTPACPMADMIENMVRDAIIEIASNYKVSIEITFDPMWNIGMIKDKDVKRMFS